MTVLKPAVADRPLVSVIITTYGDCSTLRRAIASVLAQTYKNLEIIVVDDNGDGTSWREKTEILMSRYRDAHNIKYVCHAVNLKGSAARNTGIKSASGRYVTFLDNDDVMLSHRLEHAVDALKDDRYDVYFCNVLMVNQGCFSVKTLPSSGLTWKDLLFDAGCMGTGSNIFLRAKALGETGLFDVTFRRNQDVEYMLRVLLEHNSVCMDSIDLIKSSNGTCNMESLASYLDTKRHFDEVFKSVIERLDGNEENKRLVSRERELLDIAIYNGDCDACSRFITRLSDFGAPLSRGENALAMARCNRNPFIAFAEKSAKRLRHIKICLQLGSETVAEVQRFMAL